jgi:hypothetical protein
MRFDMKHTKEPWYVDCGNLIYEREENNCIGEAIGAGISNCQNARRIVACVNACAGISNEELELRDVKPVKAASDHIAQLEQRNAELVEALINSEKRIQYLEQELFNVSDFDEGN